MTDCVVATGCSTYTTHSFKCNVQHNRVVANNKQVASCKTLPYMTCGITNIGPCRQLRTKKVEHQF